MKVTEIVFWISKNGGFTASLRGRYFHDVVLDEAHKMLINKYMKKVTTRPCKEYFQQMAGYHQHRALNITEQVVLSTSEGKHTKDVHNIGCILKQMADEYIFTHCPAARTLILLTFRQVGQEEYNSHVKYRYTKRSSTIHVVAN